MKLYEIVFAILGVAGLIFAAVSFFIGFEPTANFVCQYWWLILCAIVIVTCCLAYGNSCYKKGEELSRTGWFILIYAGGLVFSFFADATVADPMVRHYCIIPLAIGLCAVIGWEGSIILAMICFFIEPVCNLFGIYLPGQKIGISQQKKYYDKLQNICIIIITIVTFLLYLILPLFLPFRR